MFDELCKLISEYDTCIEMGVNMLFSDVGGFEYVSFFEFVSNETASAKLPH